ncbi:nuclear transport factor 2 family protein [Novosphingobium sp. AP12]|uniref:nuclear transport factor 2 family protein n=1 Tax=Novosphingobium sp. AP12 TaxID=1144305 RepID=UPI000271FB29|nr:nuclear transport factor 2 family protein [Novosphingobium sp. AP12]EJL28926.1 ketosteroid isomerase-like protein [Novosphingobium sp. AP12]
MSQQQNIAIAQRLLEGIGSGRSPEDIAALCATDLRFEIQGDAGVLPWIGHRVGRAALADFIREIRLRTESIAFEVEDIVTSDTRAAIIGALKTRIKATDKVIDCQFAIILTLADGLIARFQMLEDSFAVSKAAGIIPVATFER